VRAMERRLARLEVARAARDEALVGPDVLLRMAAVTDAECARIREELLGDGPFIPAVDHGGVESDARRMLREKLLRDDPAAPESARA